MYRYRLYTEDKENLETIILHYFQGFTIHYGTGYYDGTGEASAVIEILTDKDESDNIKLLAKEIKSVNEQDSVLVTLESIFGKEI